MKITIDTTHDSHEDIKKVIRFLSQFVGEEQRQHVSPVQETETYAPMDMFGGHEEKHENPEAGMPMASQKVEAAEASVPAGLFNIFGDNQQTQQSTSSNQEPEQREEKTSEDLGVQFY